MGSVDSESITKPLLSGWREPVPDSEFGMQGCLEMRGRERQLGADEAATQWAERELALAQAAGWTTRLESALNWSRSHSLTPIFLTGGCCGAAGMETGIGPRPDLDELGSGIPHYAPRHADLLIVSGPVTAKRAPAIRRLHRQMADPKWVVAFGNCACSGGGSDNYAVSPGLGTLLPVDIFIPGCPPRAEALLDGLRKLRAQIRGSINKSP
jgi:NADH-quinone oxidoreductase subunit B